jgi:phenylacetate-CoA ligase
VTGYHFCSEAVLCELVDERGDLVPPGEYGRVVVTALYNYAMPFIRYETGDYARAGALLCACGRGLPSIENIGGRARNLIVMSDGTRKRLPGVFFHHVSRFLSYRQIQIIQDKIQSFEIRYQPDAPTVPDVEGLTRLVREHVNNPDAMVILVPVEKIERGTGMKYEQFISRVSA